MVGKNRGRPIIQEQVQIERTLRPYFERNLSASFTARMTKYNVKTVCKYFDELADQIRESEEKDFVEREKKERERIRLSFDNIIFEEYELLDEIKKEIAKYKQKDQAVPRYLIASQLEILRTISSMTEKKGSFLLQMPLDESIQKMIEAKMKNVNTKPGN
jgi:hypothetical protein